MPVPVPAQLCCFLPLLASLSLVYSCLTSYTITSGTNTVYVPDTGPEKPCIFQTSAIGFGWLNDPDTPWVWYTTHYQTGTHKFEQRFEISQWSISSLGSARLKIAANDYLRVLFNGELLKDFDAGRDDSVYLVYSLIGKLKGADSTRYQANLLEMYVRSEDPADGEGLIYRIELSFS